MCYVFCLLPLSQLCSPPVSCSIITSCISRCRPLPFAKLSHLPVLFPSASSCLWIVLPFPGQLDTCAFQKKKKNHSLRSAFHLPHPGLGSSNFHHTSNSWIWLRSQISANSNFLSKNYNGQKSYCHNNIIISLQTGLSNRMKILCQWKEIQRIPWKWCMKMM